jgi:hypothetical protein
MAGGFHLLIALPSGWYHSPSRFTDAPAMTFLVPRSNHAGALDAALEGLSSGGGLDAARGDTPDQFVTTIRRLPPVAAQYVPFPSELDQRLREALRVRHSSGRGHWSCTRRKERRCRHADGVWQDAVLQRANPARRASGPGDTSAVPVSHKSSRAGSARGAARPLRAACARREQFDRGLHLRR